jgi:DNA-binding response OmpR family regulator
VIFISGRSQPADVELGLQCGADDYFIKPLDTMRLVERVGEILTPGAAVG